MMGVVTTRVALGVVSVVTLLTVPRTAGAETVKCKRTIAKASAQFVQGEHKALQKCVAARRAAGDSPAGTLSACKTDPKTSEALTKATSKLEAAIDKACGGADKLCGGDTTGEDSPASLGWPAFCPNFENGACNNTINDCNDLTTCLECIGRNAVEQIVTVDYESFSGAPIPGSDENKCQIAISKALLGFFNAKSKALQKCWDAVLNGKTGFSAPCPSGDSSGKTQAAIDKAEAKKIAAICKACGGGGDADKNGSCDAAGFNPQTQIGFQTTCPALQVPGGPDCGAIGTIDTLQKYVDCVDCVVEFKVDCVDRNAVLGELPYPADCNPAIPINLSAGAAVGKDLEVSLGGNLNVPAPPGGVQLTITSADPSKLLLSLSATAAGSASIMVPVSGGSTYVPSFYVQALTDSGTVGITATAPGYSQGNSTVTLHPSGFVSSTGDFTWFTISPDHPLNVTAARLDPVTLAAVESQAVRGGLSVNVPVTSDMPSVGTIVGSPAVFNGGDLGNDATAFHPAGAGTATITIGVPPGFSTPTPSGSRELTVTVTQPSIYSYANVYLTRDQAVVGRDLQIPAYVYLDAVPPGPVTVTVTSSDGSLVSLSQDETMGGSTSVSFPGVTGQFVGQVWVQGRGIGTPTLSLTASAYYAAGSASVTVDPAGFVSDTGNFTTFAISPDTAFSVVPFRLDPMTMTAVEHQAVRGGLSVSVDVNSDTPSVGTIVGSPATFNGGDYGQTSPTAFHPVADGTATVTIDVPPGFDTPSSGRQFTVTVTQPSIHIYANVVACCYYTVLDEAIVGRDLQVTASVYLDATPPSPVTITVTSSDGSLVSLSTDPTMAGGTSVSFPGVTGTSVGTVYVQGRGLGMPTLSLTASSFFVPGSASVRVDPAGFVSSIGDFSTSEFSPDTPFSIVPMRLDPMSGNSAEQQPVRGGLSVSVPVASDTPSVGTVTGSPAVFDPGNSVQNAPTTFDPVAVGTATVTLGVPAGFTMPNNGQQFTVTVTQPSVHLAGNVGTDQARVGLELEVGLNVYLDIDPPSPVTVTVTSSDASFVSVSTDPTTAGSASVSFPGVTGTFAGTVWVQGRSFGNPTLNLTASGYLSGSAGVDVDESGFVSIYSSFTTTASSPDTPLDVRPARLDPATLNVAEYETVRGGLSVQVVVTSEPPGVGRIVDSPGVFNGGDSQNLDTAFRPVGPGTNVVTIGVPTGFSPPNNQRQITVTVTP